MRNLRNRATGTVAAAIALMTMAAGAPAAHGVTTETPYPYAGAGPYASLLAVGGPEQHVYTGWGGGKIVESSDSGAALRTVVELTGYLYGFDVDDAGNVYVSLHSSASGKPELRKLSPSGQTLWSKELTDMDRRQSLNLSGNLLWMTAQPDVIAVDPATGEEVRRFSPNGWAVEPLASGNILVALQAGALTEFTPTGTFVRQVPDVQWPFTATTGGDIVSVRNSAPMGSPASNSLRMLTASGQSTFGHDLGTAGVSDLVAAPTGVVWAIVQRSGQYSLMKIDPRTPDVSLTSSGALAETGVPVVLDASGSFVPFAAPSRYEWDLDGDGSFETDSGTTGRITKAYDTRGVRAVTVRVTAPAGGTATASTSVDVRAVSPVGPVGVSVNNGAMYTNNPNVTVHMRWPKYAQDVVISNDGGFFPASQRAVESTMTWTLDSSGPERLPKTIYARFVGGQAGAETYQDDIVLDQTVPSVIEAAATPKTVSSRTADIAPRLGKVTYRVNLKAVDKTSGVKAMQITYRKANPGKWLTYTKRTTFKSPKTKIFVRVQDRAGNVSRWKRLTLS